MHSSNTVYIKAHLKQSLTSLVNLRVWKSADNNLCTGEEGERNVWFNIKSSKEAEKIKFVAYTVNWVALLLSLFRTGAKWISIKQVWIMKTTLFRFKVTFLRGISLAGTMFLLAFCPMKWSLLFVSPAEFVNDNWKRKQRTVCYILLLINEKIEKRSRLRRKKKFSSNLRRQPPSHFLCPCY